MTESATPLAGINFARARTAHTHRHELDTPTGPPHKRTSLIHPTRAYSCATVAAQAGTLTHRHCGGTSGGTPHSPRIQATTPYPRARLSRGLGHISSSHACALPTDVWSLHVPCTRSYTHSATAAACAVVKLPAAPLWQRCPHGVARCNPVLTAIDGRSRQRAWRSAGVPCHCGSTERTALGG